MHRNLFIDQHLADFIQYPIRILNDIIFMISCELVEKRLIFISTSININEWRNLTYGCCNIWKFETKICSSYLLHSFFFSGRGNGPILLPYGSDHAYSPVILSRSSRIIEIIHCYYLIKNVVEQTELKRFDKIWILRNFIVFILKKQFSFFSKKAVFSKRLFYRHCCYTYINYNAVIDCANFASYAEISTRETYGTSASWNWLTNAYSMHPICLQIIGHSNCFFNIFLTLHPHWNKN